MAVALEALKNGEIDCVFPANLSTYDAETRKILMSPAVMNTDVYAVVRQSNYSVFSNREHITVAVTEGNSNYDSFLLDKYPNWRKVYYKDIEECLNAVSNKVADCVLISNFRYNNISRLCEKYRLTTYSTGVNFDFCIAISTGQNELYSIITKITGLVPTSTINSALSYYISEDAKLTFRDFVFENLVYVITFVSLILILISLLLLRSMYSVRKAKMLISATETDDLTGLYNRDYFFEYANRMYCEHPDTPRDAIVINIEQFHSINAFNGREFGDRILCFLGNEISAIANEHGGIGGRFGADRFDIYCLHSDEYADRFNRIQTKINKLMPNISTRLRMGVMPWQKGIPPQHLIDQALVACNIARRQFKDPLIIFDDTLSEQENREMRILSDLPRALREHEFEVYYQPKYDIRTETPELYGAEALVRWRHPDLGILSPNEFIPLFEENGNVEDIDKYVWKEAAKQVAIWQKKYKKLIPVSINLSRVDVFDPDIEQTLDAVLEENGLDYNAISLEVTESAYSGSTEKIISVINGLHKKGYKIEMDDFGTGYSSLNMLYSMPIDGLKMDRAFVRNIEHSEKNLHFVELILDIAKNLNVPVVAEGIETETQYQTLKKVGCSFAQGFYFSIPLTAYEFEINVIEKYSEHK